MQWLGELWRKYHQVFVLLDDARLADVARDFGADFNPFDAHRAGRGRARDAGRAAAADAAGGGGGHRPAGRGRGPPPAAAARGSPGNPAWRAVAPIAALGRHVLLLTATPLEDDAHGFFRLLQLLRPEEFPEGRRLRGAARARRAAAPVHQLHAARRHRRAAAARRAAGRGTSADVGAAAARWNEHRPRASRRRTRSRARARPIACARALASGPRSARCWAPDEAELHAQAGRGGRRGPAPAWLLAQAPRWKQRRREDARVRRPPRDARGAAHRAQPPRAAGDRGVPRGALARAGATSRSRSSGGREGAEPADLDRVRRRGAQLRVLPSPRAVRPALEPGRGRAAHRPARPHRPPPARRDRVLPPAGGIGAEVVRLFEALGLFREPLAGLEAELAGVAPALEAGGARGRRPSPSPETFDALLTREAQGAHTRIREAAYHELHRDPYRPERAEEILARVPADLDALNQDVVVAACEQPGLPRRAAARAAARSRSSSATRRSSTACPASPAARASSAPSIAREAVRTRRSTSSRPAIRWSKACSRTSRRARSAASPCCARRSGGPPGSGSSPSTRTAPHSRRWWSTSRDARGRTGRRRCADGPCGRDAARLCATSAGPRSSAGWPRRSHAGAVPSRSRPYTSSRTRAGPGPPAPGQAAPSAGRGSRPAAARWAWAVPAGAAPTPCGRRTS